MKPRYIHTVGQVICLLTLCANALSGYGQTPPKYEIRELGAYHGRYVYNVAEKINNPGQIAGVALVRSGEAHPVLYSHGRVIDLGLLPGQLHATVEDMNDKGEIVGVQSTGGSADPNYVPIAYLFSEGRMINLVELTGVSDLFPNQ